MAFTSDFGLRATPERRQTIALMDDAVDQQALFPALRWVSEHPLVEPGAALPDDVPHLRAFVLYQQTGDYSGLPMREGAPPPDPITYRPLTVVERAAIDSLSRRVVPDGAGSFRVEHAPDERRVLAFALAADIPGLPATIKAHDGREVPKRRYDPRLGRERLSDEVLAALSDRLGEQVFTTVGELILRGSEASRGDTFRGRGDGVARGAVGAGAAETEAPADPAVRDVPAEPAGGAPVPGPGAG